MIHPSSTAAIALSALAFASACGNSDDAGAGTVQVAEAPKPTMLPTATDPCSTLATGTQQFKGLDVQLWVGERREDVKGPVLFYWHGTGSVSAEAGAFMQSQIEEIVSEGGIVASFTTSLGTGTYTGPFVWYQDDFLMADQILACAIEQLNIDTRRIYAAGCSAGGLQTTVMAYVRSGYLAAVMPNSGGTFTPPELQDPEHVPAVITTHGAPGQDRVVIEFAETSANLVRDIAAKGGFAVNCNHGLGHCRAPAEVIAAQWQFLKDHPYGTKPSPYENGLPSTFPSYCSIAQP
jgi:poly(3-hydroxybutyrate) depolymerase